MQRKLARLILVTCGVVLVLTFSALLVYEYFSYRDIARRELQSTGQIIAVNSSSALMFQYQEDAAQVLRSLRTQKSILAAAIYTNDGKLFVRYGNSPVPAGIASTPVPASYEVRQFHMEGYEPIYENGKRYGTLYLYGSLNDVYGRLGLYAAIAAVIIGVSVLLALAFSRRLQRTLASPILELAETAGIVTRQQNYSVRATRRYNDEVGQLTDAFNEMLARIEEKNDEILALNQSLEAKVEDRTRQLQESNASLQAQKEFTEAIIESSIDVIAVFDSQGYYLAANQQCVRHFNRDRSELLGHRYFDVFPGLRDSLFQRLFEEALAGKMIRDDAYRSQVSDRWFQNFFIPIRSAAGVVEQVMVVGHDITEIMETNGQLKALNADLEKSNRDLEQFAYIASHDLQEPLRKIQTFADLSLRNVHYKDILERYLQKITSSAERMSSLIRDVLNYSRLTRQGGETHVPVNLNEILAQVRTDLELVIEEKQALVHAAPLPEVNGNPLQLNQLFLNLLGNALKFNRQRPEIAVQCHSIDAAGARVPLRPGNYFEVTVSDNGIGFESEYADKIFSIFQRLHGSDEYAGTGIGLALCKKIAENHGGGIAVTSTPGSGSTFYIYLPAGPAVV